MVGHKGVLFSVNFDGETDTVISTSDDRSVRTWKLERGQHFERKHVDSVRHLFSSCQIGAQHELYGHEARVWNSLVVPGQSAGDGCRRIATLGEDSRICLWNLTSGDLLGQCEAHQGASVWSLDWIAERNSLVSGGGDGSIRLWNIADHFAEPVCHPLKFLADDGDEDIPRLVAATTRAHWTITLNGTLYGWNDDPSVGPASWIRVFHDQSMRSGCVVDAYANSMAVGSLCGSVLVFSCSQWSLLSSIIYSPIGTMNFSLFNCPLSMVRQVRGASWTSDCGAG